MPLFEKVGFGYLTSYFLGMVKSYGEYYVLVGRGEQAGSLRSANDQIFLSHRLAKIWKFVCRNSTGYIRITKRV